MEQLFAIFAALKNLEFTVSELYGIFALKCSAQDKEFWEQLRKAELKHVKNINTMIEYIRNNPEDFIAGKAISVKAVKLVIEGY